MQDGAGRWGLQLNSHRPILQCALHLVSLYAPVDPTEKNELVVRRAALELGHCMVISRLGPVCPHVLFPLPERAGIGAMLHARCDPRIA